VKMRCNMNGPGEKNQDLERDPRADKFEEAYSNVGVEVVTLTTTGSWSVVETDKRDDSDD